MMRQVRTMTVDDRPLTEEELAARRSNRRTLIVILVVIVTLGVLTLAGVLVSKLS